MSRIRSKNTKVELLIFRALRKQKIYFVKHYNRVVGRPDLALPKKKIAVFIDGDFWHGRHFKKNGSRLPKVYWQDKIRKNIERDKRNRRALKNMGWKILQVWQNDIEKKSEKTIDKIAQFLRK